MENITLGKEVWIKGYDGPQVGVIIKIMPKTVDVSVNSGQNVWRKKHIEIQHSPQLAMAAWLRQRKASNLGYANDIDALIDLGGDPWPFLDNLKVRVDALQKRASKETDTYKALLVKAGIPAKRCERADCENRPSDGFRFCGISCEQKVVQDLAERLGLSRLVFLANWLKAEVRK